MDDLLEVCVVKSQHNLIHDVSCFSLVKWMFVDNLREEFPSVEQLSDEVEIVTHFVVLIQL